MASKNLVSNLKVITSGNAPTTSQLANGEMAFGVVNGRVSIWGNYNNEVVDLLVGVGVVYLDTLPEPTDTAPALVVVTGETNG